MVVERLAEALRFDRGDRFYMLYGPGVEDVFITQRYTESRRFIKGLRVREKGSLLIMEQNMKRENRLNFDSVNWTSLSDAYGAATKVPGMLNALLSPERKVRHNAWQDLYSHVWHQGTIYSASSY